MRERIHTQRREVRNFVRVLFMPAGSKGTPEMKKYSLKI